MTDQEVVFSMAMGFAGCILISIAIFHVHGYLAGLKALSNGKVRGVFKMPRIFKFAIYGMVVMLMWKFVSNVEGIVMFLASKLGG